MGIGGSRGGRARRTPPYGTQFFCFCIHFPQKVPTSEVHTPQRVHAPLQEILDPPLMGFIIIGRKSQKCVFFRRKLLYLQKLESEREIIFGCLPYQGVGNSNYQYNLSVSRTLHGFKYVVILEIEIAINNNVAFTFDLTQ